MRATTNAFWTRIGLPHVGLFICLALSTTGFTCAPSEPNPEVSCESDAAPAMGRQVTLGISEAGEFRPMVQDETLALDFGSQGGQHVFVSLRYFLPETPGPDESWSHEFKLTDPNNEDINLGGRTTRAESCDAGEWATVHNLRVILNSSTTTKARLEVMTQLRDINFEVVDAFGDETMINIQ